MRLPSAICTGGGGGPEALFEGKENVVDGLFGTIEVLEPKMAGQVN